MKNANGSGHYALMCTRGFSSFCLLMRVLNSIYVCFGARKVSCTRKTPVVKREADKKKYIEKSAAKLYLTNIRYECV